MEGISLRQQPYLHSPSDLVDHVTSNVQLECPEGCQLLVELLQHYRELLADHTQAEVLQNLGLGKMVLLVNWKLVTYHGMAVCLRK